MGRTSYVQDDITKGRLVVPFKIALPADAGFYLVSPQGRADRGKLSAFRPGSAQPRIRRPDAPRSAPRQFRSTAFFRWRRRDFGLVAPDRRAKLPHTAGNCLRRRNNLRRPILPRGGKAVMSQSRSIASTANQVTSRRDPARDQRQFPRAIRFLPVRLLCANRSVTPFSLRPNQTAALLNAYGVFWIGALMRPVGAIVLGAYIDRIGRRKGLIVTLAIMAVGTVVIAICPTYATIGIAAPIIVAARPPAAGLLCRRRARRRLGLSRRDRHARQSRLLHLVPIMPASRSRSSSLRSSATSSSESMPARHRRRLGLAHPVLRRLPDHSGDLRVAPHAGGNPGLPGHEEASDARAKCLHRRLPTGALSSSA